MSEYILVSELDKQDKVRLFELLLEKLGVHVEVEYGHGYRQLLLVDNNE